MSRAFNDLVQARAAAALWACLTAFFAYSAGVRVSAVGAGVAAACYALTAFGEWARARKTAKITVLYPRSLPEYVVKDMEARVVSALSSSPVPKGEA